MQETLAIQHHPPAPQQELVQGWALSVPLKPSLLYSCKLEAPSRAPLEHWSVCLQFISYLTERLQERET